MLPSDPIVYIVGVIVVACFVSTLVLVGRIWANPKPQPPPRNYIHPRLAPVQPRLWLDEDPPTWKW